MPPRRRVATKRKRRDEEEGEGEGGGEEEMVDVEEDTVASAADQESDAMDTDENNSGNAAQEGEDQTADGSSFSSSSLSAPRQFTTELPDTADLQHFLKSLDKFKPAVPDELAAYYLRSAGFNTSDRRVLRLVALAAQKFIAEVCTDSMQYCLIRQKSNINRDLKLATTPAGKKAYVLTQEDLASALSEYGISIRKPEYYTDEVNFTRGGKSSSSSRGGGSGSK